MHQYYQSNNVIIFSQGSFGIISTCTFDTLNTFFGIILEVSLMSFNLSLLLSVVEPTGPELVNPCYAGNHDCDTTAQCIPLEGQAFQCQCATGYRGDGRNCYGIFVSQHFICACMYTYGVLLKKSFWVGCPAS